MPPSASLIRKTGTSRPTRSRFAQLERHELVRDATHRALPRPPADYRLREMDKRGRYTEREPTDILECVPGRAMPESVGSVRAERELHGYSPVLRMP